MRIRAVVSALESFAPSALQEGWDNTGFQVGSLGAECTGVLVCLDVSEAVISEAVERGCNLVVSHHPLIFKGLKRIAGASVVERTVVAAIRAGVSVYSTHTSLDSTEGGISYEMARMLGLRPAGVLAGKEGLDVRVTAYVPRELSEDVELALLDSGAESALTTDVSAARVVRAVAAGDLPEWSAEHEALRAVSVDVRRWEVRNAVDALNGLGLGRRLGVEISALENQSGVYGLGVVARPAEGEELTMSEFAEHVKRVFGVKRLRISSGVSPDSPVRTVALCGGSGGEFIGRAVGCGADVYVTADIRYHDFADYSGSICLMDVGHFESEICAKDIFYRVLTKKIPNFAVYKSELEKNPVNYL
jgi:dinuclear metal center YbgI/SA1388 family protein